MEELGRSGRNRVEVGGTEWNWVGIGRKQGESGRNWVELGGTGWILEELGGSGRNWEETR